MPRSLILASGSPRRKQLLESVGVAFEVVVSEVEESLEATGDPGEIALALASEKGAPVAQKHSGAFVLSADTVVAIPSSTTWDILGKPEDENEAFSMIASLRDRQHVVCTGFALRCEEEGYSFSRAVHSEVSMRSMSDEDIWSYVKTGECMGKAGAYAIQGLGACFVSSIKGSYTNVVGLPLAEVCEELERQKLWSTGSFPGAVA